jgi:hypothetical protein
VPSKRQKFTEGYGDNERERDILFLFLPKLGNVTLKLETNRPLEEDDKEPKLVLSVDFPIDRINIIDRRGNTIELGATDAGH